MTTIEQIVREFGDNLIQHGKFWRDPDGDFSQVIAEDWLRQKLEGLIEEVAGEVEKEQHSSFPDLYNGIYRKAAQIIRSFNQK